MNKIEYYAANSTMGDTSDEDCEKYRQWATEQIKNEYPGHNVNVINQESLVNSWTNDEEKKEEIIDFCSRLWDRCPWDWCE